MGLIGYEFGNNTYNNKLILGGTKMLMTTVKLSEYAGNKDFDLNGYISQLISTPSEKNNKWQP